MQSEIESLKTDKAALNSLLLKTTERFRSTVVVLETAVELPRDISEALAPARGDGGGDPLDRLQQVRIGLRKCLEGGDGISIAA